MAAPPLLRFRTLDSTQSFLRRHPELGTCGVLADRQTAGRGRWGNAWASAAGQGLYLSMALPDPGLGPGATLQAAMRHAAACLGSDRLGLKWPNDLVAREGGVLVKVGGVLGERDGDRLLLGLGINLGGAPDLPESALPARCLADLGLPVPDPVDLARRILGAWTDLAAAPEPAFRWPSAGDPVRWAEGQGVVLGWEPDGRLRLAGPGGILRLASGDLSGLRST